jgi:hypothetical protein
MKQKRGRARFRAGRWDQPRFENNGAGSGSRRTKVPAQGFLGLGRAWRRRKLRYALKGSGRVLCSSPAELELSQRCFVK